MSDNVIPFGKRVQPATAPLEWDGFVCPDCGGAWMEVPVIFDKLGKIIGNGLKAKCADCGVAVDAPYQYPTDEKDESD